MPIARRLLSGHLVTRRKPRDRGTRQQRGYGPEYQAERARILADATECHWCGRAPSRDDPLTADHLIPVSRGGRDILVLVPAHRSCNAKRGNKPAREARDARR